MRSIVQFAGATRNLQGDLIVTFTPEDESILGELEAVKDKRLVLEVTKYSDKRSLNANAYFWKLCGLIAETLGTTKDEVYCLQLSKYGFWLDKDVHKAAVPEIRQMFRYVEEFEDTWKNDDGEEMTTIRCYIGSSHYSKAEMSRLIDGTVQDANEIGITTWTQEEIDNLVQNWRPKQ